MYKRTNEVYFEYKCTGWASGQHLHPNMSHVEDTLFYMTFMLLYSKSCTPMEELYLYGRESGVYSQGRGVLFTVKYFSKYAHMMKII